MKKWETEIYNNHHKKMMIFHLVFAIIPIAISIIIFFTLLDMTHNNFMLVMLIPCLFPLPLLLFHLLLAYGGYKRIEIARKISEFFAVLLFLGFPIGTLIGYFFLQTTQWNIPEKSTPKL